ncbi:hypothetical protein NW762_013755 [Fusarium torreyae]|uniref:Uncharacterized protein n=1 Tax=Fusarium torreyae TaxID=1237075 RepID=A0A9W8RMX2_9HYPO|nr:hypothetical protein NW762_013755 [Fusarium torreyae]
MAPSSANDSRRKSWTGSNWLVEGTSVLVSCLITLGLCLLLARFDGHNAPDFGSVPNWGITLNTIVAIMINLAVATSISAVVECVSQLKWLWFSEQPRSLADIQIFDEASRGLFGSLKLIWGIRQRSVASLGAFLVVVQLAVAPLTQQSLHYESRGVAVEGINATTPVRTRYFESIQEPLIKGTPAGYSSLGAGMKAAIISGLFMDTDVTINNTLPSCPSGNCTFGEYSTLAVCATFANVTSYLESRSEGKKQSVLEYCIADGICMKSLDQTDIVKGNMTSAARGEQLDAPLTTRRRSPESYNYTSMAFKDHPSPIADFYVIYADTDDHSSDGYGFLAVEIVLEWCVQKFSTKVVNGTATSVRLEHASKNFTQHGTQSFQAEVDGEVYSVDLPTHCTLQRHLSGYLSGIFVQKGMNTVADNDVILSFARALGLTNAPVRGRLKKGYPRLGAILDNTATSMTNYLRQSSSQTTNGTVYTEQIYVRISWGWLAAPIVFVVLTLLFFVVTLIYSRVRKIGDVPAWKSSLLAALQSPDADLHQLLGSTTLQTPMSAKSRKQQVQLIKTGDQWNLTGSVPHVDVSDQTPLQQKDQGIQMSSLELSQATRSLNAQE